LLLGSLLLIYTPFHFILLYRYICCSMEEA
jgi:hypothetical protein